ncbi:transcriptional regulator/sugar kinase [Opitutaceae bacterium TAV1]|nr:transcriptional regulator/sugar kinase [Opitutaceae bacterium TAV1]
MEFFEKAWPLAESGEGAFTQKAGAERNRLRVLGLIARRQCLSQRQITRATRLQASTVSNIVRDLKESGLVREGAPIEAERVGPKETELELVADAAWSLGVGLEPLGHRLTLANAAGHVLTQETLPPGMSVDELAALLPARLAELADRSGLAMGQFAGAGISVPGVVDSASGTILMSRSLGVTRFPLRQTIAEKLGHPVWVERNVACGAYAEHHIGAARDRDSFIYFLLRNDPGQPRVFGLALVIGEKIFHGSNSAAGEVDRNLLSACFTLASGQAGAADPLSDEASLDAFYRAWAEGLAGIVNLLDVSCLILSTNDERFTRDRFGIVRDTVDRNLIPVPGRRFDLLRSGMGLEGTVLGGALLALHRGLASRLGQRKAGSQTAASENNKPRTPRSPDRKRK